MKIPCIECDVVMWRYIKGYLKQWGYNISPNILLGCFDVYPLLVINYNDKLYNVCNVHINYKNLYNRELVNNVDEFLSKAAELKGFKYNKYDNNNYMDFLGIKLKPGMGIYIENINFNGLYIIIPVKNGLGLIPYGLRNKWMALDDDFLNIYKDKIVAICGLPEKGITIGQNIIWKKPEKVVITLEDIAKKFGYDPDQIEIKLN